MAVTYLEHGRFVLVVTSQSADTEDDILQKEIIIDGNVEHTGKQVRYTNSIRVSVGTERNCLMNNYFLLRDMPIFKFF